MGLDQFAHKIKNKETAKIIIKSFENGDQEGIRKFYSPSNKIEICYWRKHNRLHGFFENIFSKYCDETFNCEPLPLTVEVLDLLEEYLLNKNLPMTEGFFFGEDSNIGYEEQFNQMVTQKMLDDGYISDQDLKSLGEKTKDIFLLREARKALGKGEIVVYDSWW